MEPGDLVSVSRPVYVNLGRQHSVLNHSSFDKLSVLKL